MKFWKKSGRKLKYFLTIYCFRGAFGVVHRCVERSTGNTFAAKFVNTNQSLDKETLKQEVRTMSELRHPQLINLHAAFETDNDITMIYEL